MTTYAGNIVLMGNIMDGFRIIGPFDSMDDVDPDASPYRKEEWWGAALEVQGDPWTNPLVQFARLIAEVEAAGGFAVDEIWDALELSMDLNTEELKELVERAMAMWDATKAQL